MKGIFRLLSKPVVLYSTLAVLVLGVIALIYWNFTLIETNVSAQAQIEERETAVIEHSKKLKEIAEMYHKAHGRYPGSCDEIVSSHRTASLLRRTRSSTLTTSVSLRQRRVM
jgi:hypothetical protein